MADDSDTKLTLVVEALIHLGIDSSFVNQEQPTSSDYLE